MLTPGQNAWTDEKIQATVTPTWCYQILGEAANQPVAEAIDSDSTYGDYIVSKAKRLFLTVIDVGLPQQILRLVDEFYDDDYLPFAEDEVASLRLSSGLSNLDSLFYRVQFKYLVRVLREGEHIRYSSLEYIPVQPVEHKAGANTNEDSNKVLIPSPVNRVFIRRQISIRDIQAELSLLAEIAAAKPLSHEHLLSIHGSYTQKQQMHILLSPSTKYNLKSFLNDPPKVFEALPKPERRKHFLLWPHCLCNALAWLHAHGAHHGAVRPSRIFIDDFFQISLGSFDGDWLLGVPAARDDIEAYQYAGPEFWKRGLTVQSHGTSRTAFSSGGRSAGRLHLPSRGDDISRPSNDGSTDSGKALRSSEEGRYTFVPTSKNNPSRLKLKPANRLSADFTPFTRNVESRLGFRSDADSLSRPKRTLSRRLDTLSLKSSDSSEAGKQSDTSRSRFAHALPLDTKATMVQAWKSTARDMAAADIFGLAAVSMDMITVLCSRSVSSFTKHRASKNRNAGRGGSVADASFHANLAQIVSWAETLVKDAEKKAKKDNAYIFNAVEPILQKLLPCFDKEPNNRSRSELLSLELHKHLRSVGNTHAHCTLRPAEGAKEHKRKEKQQPESHMFTAVREPESSTRAQPQARPPVQQVRQPPPQDQYYEVDAAPVTPLFSYPRSSTRAQHSQRAPPPSVASDRERDVSPDLFEYYESQWQDPRYRLQTQQTAHYRPAQRMTRRDFIDDPTPDEEDEEDDDQEPLHPLRPPRTTSINTNSTRYYSSASHFPSPVLHYGNSDVAIMASEPASQPPNRELPAIPAATPNSKKTRQAARTPATTRAANVAQATQALAQTVGRFG